MSEQLLQLLRARANRRGLLLVRESVLIEALQIDSPALQRALQHLERGGQIMVLSPGKYLVIRVTAWSGHEHRGKQNPQEMAAAEPRGYSYAYSFNNHTIDKSKAIAGADDAAGQGEEALLREILVTLGESDPTTFRGVLTNYAPATVRAVLERVRRTPPEKVRKSKTAYFRFLLAKFGK